jgi:CRISPR system Cascade subunit CasE
LFATSSQRAEIPLLAFAMDDLSAAATRQVDALFLLAYSEIDASALVRSMGERRQQIVALCEAREMPAFAPNQQLGFRTRVCPVVRTRRPGQRSLETTRGGRTRHREMDAFVHATLAAEAQVPIDREDVYVRWLSRELQRGGASRLESARLTEFCRQRMRRGDGEPIERPNAVLEGRLTVLDPEAFRALLMRGLGRHRAFGFGMLLVRPPEC